MSDVGIHIWAFISGLGDVCGPGGVGCPGVCLPADPGVRPAEPGVSGPWLDPSVLGVIGLSAAGMAALLPLGLLIGLAPGTPA